MQGIRRYFMGTSFLILLWGCLSPDQPEEVNELREVTGGEIAGEFLAEDSIHVFRGIPFAAPPVDELRWKPPQPVEPWEGTLDCTEFGPSAMQNEPRPFMFWSSEFLIPETPISEDCLYLNVWTPARHTEEKLPVIVYIHGGGFQSGGSACPIYEGTSMAKKGVVFVSINYRVGKFGFLAHPELSAESEAGTSGNYAILDMIAALHWVKQNIEEFGGDPGNVTIAGQSAGSFAVNVLTVTPGARGLFHRAIGESGAGFLPSPLRGTELAPASADSLGLVFARSAGVSSLEALRELPADSILSVQGGLTAPYADGHVVPSRILAMYREGKQHDVPMLIGWNDNDVLMGEPVGEAEFRERINQRFGEREDEFFAAYPADNPEQVREAQYHMNRDESFGAQVYMWARMQDSTGSDPVYLYNFNRALPAYGPDTRFGAFHSGEIVYAYDNLHTLDRPWEETDRKIAEMMSTYWVNFARDGNPNGEGLPEWEPYSRPDENVLVIDSVTATQTLPTREKLQFWKNYYLSPTTN